MKLVLNQLNQFIINGENDELIIRGAESNLKKQTNMILATDDNYIVHSYISDDSIAHNKFIEFLQGMSNKIEKNKKYVIIMDNANYHTHKNIKKFCLNNKLNTD